MAILASGLREGAASGREGVDTAARGVRATRGRGGAETGGRDGGGTGGRVRQSQITATARTRESAAKKRVAAETRRRRAGKGGA
ncbi:MAG: hypothetical protein ACM3SU_02810 [Acidobacteriota bacterium]